MSDPTSRKLDCFIADGGRSRHVGAAFVTERRGAVVTTFQYAEEYLAWQGAWSVSPDLPLAAGRIVTSGLPGAFSDCAPDRWGRNLIRKRMLAAAPATGGAARSVSEVDFLLGVSDYTRQGALRFREAGDAFLAADASVPKLIALPELLAASDALEADAPDLSAVKALLAAGTGTLGGARPKASVMDEDQLLIAKFPHPSDEWDVMAWECVALELAAAAGIAVPAHRLLPVGERRVLLVSRFDRDGERRHPYVSAMSMLRSTDGTAHDYLEVAEALATLGASVASDLRELWRRMAFSVMINNNDDHLRNLGFLRSGNGWRLAPAFDLNPNPDLRASRVTSINYRAEAEAAHASLQEVAPYFGLSAEQAAVILREVKAAVRPWREVAVRHGIAERELRLFTPALDRFLH
ncbi:MAG: type II toxin-antitoxin system HipA family toxin [Candidatus Nanopelagicales bacterium]